MHLETLPSCLPMPTGNILFHERLLSLKVSALILLYFYTFVQPVGAVPKNISIDDQNGDGRTGAIPIYAPPSAWANQGCTGCAIKPDQNQLFQNTATAATFMPDKNVTSNTADFDFNGTAIYIFFTLFYNEGQGITVNTECNFTLDNEAPVFFNHSGDPTVSPSTKRDYRTLVFSRTGLEYKPHHMRISMSDVLYHVFLSFDYAQYTIDEAVDTPTSHTTNQTSSFVPTLTPSEPLALSSSSPSPSQTSKASKPTAGILVGGVLGGLAVLAGFLGLFWLYRRDTNRYPRPNSPDPAAPRPFVYPPTTDSIVPSAPRTRGVERSFAPSTAAGATGSPSFSTLSSTQARSMDAATRSTRSSSQPLSSTSSGSNTRGSSVEHRLRDANRRMQNLTAEMASTSSRPSKSRTRSSRSTNELLEEIKRLKQEIQTLKQSQRSPPDPPPQYDE